MTNVVVAVRDGDVIQAIRLFKKKVGRQHILVELKKHEYYLSPARKRRAKHRRVLNRARKWAAKLEAKL